MSDAAPLSAAHADRRVLDVGRVRIPALAADIAVASSVALVLGLIRLGAPSFWVDETFTGQKIHFSLIDKLDAQYHFLHLVLLQPWAWLAGTSEWALRFPSVIGEVAGVALLVVLASRLVERRVALVAGVLLATSPFLVKWSQQARGYTIFVALVVLSMLLLYRAFEVGSRAAWVVFGVAFSAVMVWQPAAALLAMPGFVALVALRRERILPHGLLAAIVIGVLGVPFAAITAMRSTGQGVNINWIQYPSPGEAAHALLDVSGAAGLGLLLASIGLRVLYRTERRELAVWLGCWAFAPFALGLVVSIFKPIYLDRFLIGAAPAFALLAAIGVLGLRPRLRLVAASAAVVATSIGLVLWYAPKDGGNWRGEDWRAASRAALAEHGSDDIVVAPWWANPGAKYYGVPVRDTSLADSIWVLSWSEEGHRLPTSVRAPLGFGDHQLVEEQDFGWRLHLQHWVRP